MDEAMDVRLALCGASGTGKTTLAKWAEDELGLPFNPIGSRSVAKMMGFDNPYDVDAAGQRKPFQRRLVLEKRKWEDEHESFAVDRTTLDNLAYTMVHDIYAIDRELLQSIVEGMKRYTHIVYCPISAFCNPAGDASRVGGGTYGAVGDDTYHVLFDLIIKGLLIKYRPGRVPLLKLDTDNLDERKSQLRAFLGSE